MTQVSRYPISKKVADRIFEVFLKTLVEIKSNEEADQFISDLLTPTEKIMLAKRLAIAYLLEKGYDYRTIQKIIRVSAPTITSVNNARRYGKEGYRRLISKITRDEKLKDFFDEVVVKLLSAPSALEKGRGTWSYLRDMVEEQKRKKRKAF
jgi:TrpR-related protein YerC/YecD